MEIEENPKLYKLRHSLAHVLAQAVKKQFPDVKLGFGPPTSVGFFYDFDFGTEALQEKDLQKIEKTMREIIQQNQKFSRKELNYEEACQYLTKPEDFFKRENVENLKQKGVNVFSFYENGPFSDLCEGPHVEKTGELPKDCFKLDSIAGAYWLGNEKNKMLTRIYALAFESASELTEYCKRKEMAQEFDHKKLGKELEIFAFSDYVGKGLPLWLPNGTIIREEIEKLAKEVEFKYGYKRVSTPILAKEELYKQSQHLPAYESSMYAPIVTKHEDTGSVEKFYLRPMNCPHHHLVFDNRTRSYKELPLRIAEYGTTFRYEQSGELSGLLRVRGMTLNDAHLYCRFDQIEAETHSLMKLYKEVYEIFRLKDYVFRLSIRDKERSKDKFKGDEKMWDTAETILKRVLDESKIPYYVGEGEAAFYGPKIDIQFKNLLGREETVSTIQLDFLGPINFNLNYINEEGKEERPVIIHRSPLSTHERFISFLLEYYGGAFPTWLAPMQAVLIPINDTCLAYCEKLQRDMTELFIRAEVDDSANSLNKKIRLHTVNKVPIQVIVGNNEVDANKVTLRRYGFKEQQTMDRNEFTDMIVEEIKTRKNYREPMGSIQNG